MGGREHRGTSYTGDSVDSWRIWEIARAARSGQRGTIASYVKHTVPGTISLPRQRPTRGVAVLEQVASNIRTFNKPTIISPGGIGEFGARVCARAGQPGCEPARLPRLAHICHTLRPICVADTVAVICAWVGSDPMLPCPPHQVDGGRSEGVSDERREEKREGSEMEGDILWGEGARRMLGRARTHPSRGLV